MKFEGEGVEGDGDESRLDEQAEKLAIETVVAKVKAQALWERDKHGGEARTTM